MAARADVVGADRELVARVQAGDTVAFGAVFQRHYVPVYRYAAACTGNHEDAEDIAAEVFAAAFRAIGRYRAGDTPLEAWIFRIARNEVKDHFRRKGRRLTAVPLQPGTAGEAGNGGGLENRDRLQDLANGLQVLPPGQREALLLRLVAGLSVRETAKIMKRPEGTVRSLAHHGLKALRSMMEGPP